MLTHFNLVANMSQYVGDSSHHDIKIIDESTEYNQVCANVASWNMERIFLLGSSVIIVAFSGQKNKSAIFRTDFVGKTHKDTEQPS